jgi:2,4-dienoyl-CoA reductase (NADPH2)
LTPTTIRKRLFALNWRFEPAANANLAAAIREVVNIPVIANGGFQERDIINRTLSDGKCDMVAIARPLLANPDLVDQLRSANAPERPCSFCTLCCSHTAVFPLGCYDHRRFETQEAMMRQILAWCSPNAPFSIRDGKNRSGAEIKHDEFQ